MNIAPNGQLMGVDPHPPFITLHKAMFGWKCVLLCWNDEPGGGFYEPYETSYFQFPEERIKEVIDEGLNWAESEGIEFRIGEAFKSEYQVVVLERSLKAQGYDLEALEQDNPYNQSFN